MFVRVVAVIGDTWFTEKGAVMVTGSIRVRNAATNLFSAALRQPAKELQECRNSYEEEQQVWTTKVQVTWNLIGKSTASFVGSPF